MICSSMRMASVVILACLLFAPATLEAQKRKSPRFTDPAEADADFPIQGEYLGTVAGTLNDTMGFQIIALGSGKFQAFGFYGGLPGAGWEGSKLDYGQGESKDGIVNFENGSFRAVLKKNQLEVISDNSEVAGRLVKTNRKSPTLGKQPPEGAHVLFDGSSVDSWKNGKMTDDKLLHQGTTSKQTFGSHTLHIEFRLPYMPMDRGQGRGNSGIYVQGRYEVQMLDSFGLAGKKNECGGIYSVKDCDLNMCFPPLSWQTYDIEFTEAKYENGKLVASPRMTVYHNGVMIHNNVELPTDRGTTASPVKPGQQKGPVYLQNHGCPVRYRNIWVLEQN